MLEIDKQEREEMLARWLRGHSEAQRSEALNGAVAELIDETCRAVAAGRVHADRCGSAGDAFGRAWYAQGGEVALLSDELASVRRSVWEAVLGRLRAGASSVDAVVEARAVIDAAFDLALRKALKAALREAELAEGGSTRPSPTDENGRADFQATLHDALVAAGRVAAHVGLVLLHVEIQGGLLEGRSSDLLDVSEVLRTQLRQTDLPFQLSDSDFAIICHGTTSEGARHLLDRIEYAIGLYARRAGLGAEVTGGCAVAPEDGRSALELIRVALADREFSIPGGQNASRV